MILNVQVIIGSSHIITPDNYLVDVGSLVRYLFHIHHVLSYLGLISALMIRTPLLLATPRRQKWFK